MGEKNKRFQLLLQSPLNMRARILLILAVLSITLVFQSPLWTMSFRSNQYPDPLRMSIYINHLEGQKTDRRDDLREINSLNHYIGMRPLMESDFAEFLWLPFAMGFFALITLRAIVFGTLRDLVDITVLFTYFGLFSAWTFYSRLYQYGHNLNPEAAIKVEPFTPPFFGSVQIANFWVESYPGGGTYVMALFGGLLVAALVLTYLEARGEQREASVH
jgi:hypothetical protein